MAGYLAAVLAVLLSANLFAQVPDFDQGVPDVKDVVAGLKKEAVPDGSAVQESYQVAYRSDRDCVTFVFRPDGPTVSEKVWLRSTEYREECRWEGDPRNGGRQYCREVPRWTYRELVQVELRERKELYPWEKEAVAVCLDGNWLSVHEVQLAHKYTASRNGGYYTLTAGEKKPMDPDKHGIEAAAPESTGDNLAVTFTDRWASYYAGEQVVLSMKLKREVKNWFDPVLVEKEFTFAAADAYPVDFAPYAAEFSEKLKPGSNYYVEWSFKRIGVISKPTQMKRGDGPTGTYRPRLIMVAR
ncbi:MAG: hypothetical protein ABIJ96_14495 [Elusimicrobiota bacterium]